MDGPTSSTGGACAVEHRARTLKRTISACRIDGTSANTTNANNPDANERYVAAMPVKKLAAVAARCAHPHGCARAVAQEGERARAQSMGANAGDCADLTAWMASLVSPVDADAIAWATLCGASHCHHHDADAPSPRCPCNLLMTPEMLQATSEYDAAGTSMMPHDDAPVANLQSERDYLSPVNLHASVLDYLRELFATSQCVRMFTFAQVRHLVDSVPFAVRYMERNVQERLGISWQLVERFVNAIVAFVHDDDLRDATVFEFAGFLHSVQHTLYESMPLSNIFANLDEFFQHVLVRFKKYLVHAWLATKRISAPCEFGKKSDTLFLCMECHREHR